MVNVTRWILGTTRNGLNNLNRNMPQDLDAKKSKEKDSFGIANMACSNFLKGVYDLILLYNLYRILF